MDFFKNMKIKGPKSKPQAPTQVQSETTLTMAESKKLDVGGSNGYHLDDNLTASGRVINSSMIRKDKIDNVGIKSGIKSEEVDEQKQEKSVVGGNSTNNTSSNNITPITNTIKNNQTKPARSNSKIQEPPQNEADTNDSEAKHTAIISPKHISRKVSDKNNSQEGDVTQDSVRSSNTTTSKTTSSIQSNVNPTIDKIQSPRQAPIKKTVTQTIKPNLTVKPTSTIVPTSTASRPKTQTQLVLGQLSSLTQKKIEIEIKNIELGAKKVTIEKTLVQLKVNLRKAEELQRKYVEEEQLGEAERVQEQLKHLRSQIGDKRKQVDQIQQEQTIVEDKRIDASKNIGSQGKKLARKVKMIQMQVEEETNSQRRSFLETVQAERREIEKQKKRIQRLQTDINTQFQQLTKYQQTFEEDRNNLRAPYETKLQVSERQEQELVEEIEELERKLREKKKLLGQNRGISATLKKQLADIEENFRQEGKKLEERKNKLLTLETDKQILIDELSLKQTKTATIITDMDIKARQATQRVEQLAKLAERLEKSGINDDQIEETRVMADNYRLCVRQLKAFQLKSEQLEKQLEEFKFRKAALAAETNSLTKKSKQLKINISELQTEQKRLTVAKSFKAADLIKDEIKETIESIEKVKKKIRQLCDQDEQSDREIQQAIDKIIRHEQQSNDLKDSLAVSQLKFVEDRLRYVDGLIEELNLHHELKGKYSLKLENERQNLLANKRGLEVRVSTHQKQDEHKNQDTEQQQDQYQPPQIPSDVHQSQSSEDHQQPHQCSIIQNIQPQQLQTQHKYEYIVKQTLQQKAYPQEVSQQEDNGYVPLQID